MELDKIKEEITQRYQMIINYHKSIIKEHTEEVAKWEKGLKLVLANDKALTTIDNVFNGNSEPKAIKHKITKVKSKTKRKGKPIANTLEELAKAYIKELNKPASADALRIKYNTTKGSEISTANFSPRVSELAKKGTLIKCVVEGNPIKSKFLYALPYMMENGKLKTEYLLKVKAGQVQLY